MILLFDQRVDIILLAALLLIGGGVAYGLLLLVFSKFDPRKTRRRHERALNEATAERPVIFLIPCLNEAEVIGASLDRLTSLGYSQAHILVIDDGSDDGTADIILQHPDPRVHVLQRFLPNARKGKGEALNAAVQHIRDGGLGCQIDPDNAVICVLDADGRLEPHALETVMPIFEDPTIGAAQIGVRINNRQDSLLARMQDFEFVFYTEIYQRGRRHLHSVGLGGNGQFVRFSALNSLGEKPWSKSLTEDLDLGIRLSLEGWNIEFCSETAVHQQGLVDIQRWVKQRTRWFQGHLQAWGLMPWVMGKLRGKQRLDLGYHITSPYLLLVGSLLTLAFALWGIDLAADLFTGRLEFSYWWISAYLIAFGPVLLYGTVYWQVERDTGLSRLALFFMLHLFVFYSILWYLAGWRAVFRVVARRSGWAKTERLKEQPTSTPEVTDAVDQTSRTH